MRKGTIVLTRIACLLLAAVVWVVVPAKAFAQSSQKRNETQKIQAAGQPTPPDSQQDIETIKIDTNLVTVPVIATDIGGLYIPNLRQEDFNISEDGVKQDVAFFATISAPFHVILMLDTSASTEVNLGQIQRAAFAFVQQLQAKDRVKIISFDDELRDLCEFTSDRNELKEAIDKTRSGKGTRLYDAIDLALSSIRNFQGRKAIVLFTDGVDFRSVESTFDGTLRGLDEEGVIVYPIRYDTRAETERIARQSMGDPVSQLPTIGVIRPPAPGTTPTTFPSDDPNSGPPANTRPGSGTSGWPLPDIFRRGTPNDPNRGSWPPTSGPNGPMPDPRNNPRGTSPGNRKEGDSVTGMLDLLYSKADTYLKALADKSGGRLLRADKLDSLPTAFANIAAELRTQYLLGYYPTNPAHDGSYRKIKVTTTRKNVVVRSRPGYSARSGR